MVSAIITTYKRPPEVVERAAKSVLNQTYSDVELIIVDDSPASYELRDSVHYMASSLGERVTYVQHEKNMGACAARNTGIKHAKGEFVAFLDDDDEWLPEKIEKQLSVMEKNKSAALVYCGRYTYIVSEDKTIEENVEFHSGKVYEKLILNNFIGSTSFPLIRKSVAEKLGGFDVNMKAAQDCEFWLRIAREYDVDYVPEPLVRYYIHEGEQITKDFRKKVEALERLENLNSDYLKKHPKAYSIRLLRRAGCYCGKDIKIGRKLFIKAFVIFPIPSKDMLKAFKRLYVEPILQNER